MGGRARGHAFALVRRTFCREGEGTMLRRRAATCLSSAVAMPACLVELVFCPSATLVPIMLVAEEHGWRRAWCCTASHTPKGRAMHAI
jgi:hypothetical protein